MIHVVIGPPCAGKSTYVEEHAQAGDVRIDYDRIAQALGSTTPHAATGGVREVAFAARKAAIATVLAGIGEDSWIIHTSPTKEQLADYTAAGAELKVLDPGLDVALARCESDARPPGTADAIRAWYSNPPAIPEKRSRFMFTKSVPVLVKAVGSDDGLDEGVFEAIVSVFGNVDSYGDRVIEGAFKDSLAEWEASGSPIPVYWSHRMDDPDFNIGHVLDAKELSPGDELLPTALNELGGLWVKVQLDLEDGSTSKAKQVYRLLKGRRVTQFSFAYDIEDYAIVKTAEDDEPIWELRKLKLYEVGPTPIGANQATELLDVKAAGHRAERLAVEVKAGRVLSAKNEDELRKAHEAIGKVLSQLDSEDDSKASVSEPAKDEEPPAAKSEEPMRSASADTTRLRLALESES